MFRYRVFSFGYSVAVTGLTTASTVPLPSAKMKVPRYSSAKPLRWPSATASALAPGSASASGAASVMTADEACSAKATAMDTPLPMRSMTRLKRMIEIAKGNSPAPRMYPICS